MNPYRESTLAEYYAYIRKDAQEGRVYPVRLNPLGEAVKVPKVVSEIAYLRRYSLANIILMFIILVRRLVLGSWLAPCG